MCVFNNAVFKINLVVMEVYGTIYVINYYVTINGHVYKIHVTFCVFFIACNVSAFAASNNDITLYLYILKMNET